MIRLQNRWKRFVFAALTVSLTLSSLANAADDPVFSGPQAGEKLANFKVVGVLDKQGEEFDLIAEAKGGPVFIIFVHGVTRPSIGLARPLMDFAATQKKSGLTSGMIFLSDDMTAMQERVKRMSNALPQKVNVGISPDKQEGPGAYGLNRNVSLTVLVGKDNRVTANFALVQPSLQADAGPILKALAKATGSKEVPTAADLMLSRVQNPELKTALSKLVDVKAKDRKPEQLVAAVEKLLKEKPEAQREMRYAAGRLAMLSRSVEMEPAVKSAIARWTRGGRRQPANRPTERPANGRARVSEKLGGLIRAVIQKGASDEQVEKANAALEAHLKTNQADRKEVGRIATTISGSGKLGNYGTAKAQEFIKAWAKKYGTPKRDEAKPNESKKQDRPKRTTDR